MRRFVMMALVATVAITVLPQPSRAECQIVGCERHCWRVPGGVRCQNHCQQRCWQSPPRYVPPTSPHYYAPPQNYGVPVAALGAIVALIVGALSQSSNTNVVLNDTAQWRDHTEDIRAATDDTRAEVAAIDQDIESQVSAAHERGRARADELWRDLKGDHHG
jgi:hypothetical protein